MSRQTQVLAGLIDEAKAGTISAVEYLRRICSDAAKAAPEDALIEMAECVLRLGIDAGRKDAERN